VPQSENDDAKVSEIEVTNVTRLGQKAEPSDFELLKVLGQGSFGKVIATKLALIAFYTDQWQLFKGNGLSPLIRSLIVAFTSTSG